MYYLVAVNTSVSQTILYLFAEKMTRLRAVICLFRNDLRIHDNEVLVTAQKFSDFVVPLYCFDPDHYKGTWHFNLAKTGSHRAKFLIESVNDLRKNLRGLKSDLVVKNCSPAEAIQSITAKCDSLGHSVTEVIFQKEVTFEEIKVEEEIEKFCQSKNIKVNKIWGATLYHNQGTDLNNNHLKENEFWS